jgi:farnesyl diphosphate synthase
MSTQNTRQTFEAVFRDVIVPKIMEEIESTGIAKNACDWLQKVSLSPLSLALTDGSQSIKYNTIGGKYNRGMTVPDTYRLLKGVESLSEEDYKLASVLGWCTELVSPSTSPSAVTLAEIFRSSRPCFL